MQYDDVTSIYTSIYVHVTSIYVHVAWIVLKAKIKI